ncbi:MAG TPA: type II toxin-antitoxin system RelE/ParE family toxin [Gammaproteobacteria bacterium]|nr:type II toxin-antitoxin system RelE/ParE family toxin [Gammaproteobacteria bacterium]
MAWLIRVKDEAKKDLKKLDSVIQKRIYSFLEEKLSKIENPRMFGKALQGKFSKYWRYRVGDYRVICRIEDSMVTVLVIAVGHRREIYH